nr:metallophosphoesterase [Nakamurella flavida]
MSDTHLTSAGVLYNGVIDADRALAAAADLIARAVADGVGVDALVVSGDLTDTGDPAAYRRLADALGSLGPPVVWATGNHDVRTTLHTELLGRPDEPGKILQHHDIAGLRILVLDSTVVGAGHGRLEPEHLAELAAALATPAEHGSVVVLHHAPVPPPSPLLAYFTLERASRRALAATVAGSDVRLVLAGHHHLAQSGSLAGVPVAVAGSTAIRVDPLARPGHERTVVAGSLNLVRLYPDTVTVSVLPLDESLGAPQAFAMDEAACAELIARHPIVR